MECEGFRAVRRLIERGRTVPCERRGPRGKPGGEVARMLQARICGVCAFHEADCDFILTKGEAPSCGGFVLLFYLLSESHITVEDMQ